MSGGILFAFVLVGQPGVDSPSKGGLGEEPIVYSYEAVTQQEVRYTRPVIVLGAKMQFQRTMVECDGC